MEVATFETDYEIKRGKPMPSKNHAFVQGNIYFKIRSEFKEYQILTELSLQLGDIYKVPDLAIFDGIEFTPGDDEIRVTKTPLCAIEILSPTQSLSELMIKSQVYFENDVKSYWLVIPDLQSIYVFHQPNESQVFSKNDVLIDTVLDIKLDLKAIFQ